MNNDLRDALEWLKLNTTPTHKIEYVDPVTGDGGSKVVFPAGFNIVDLERPAHRSMGHVVVATFESLVDYVGKYVRGGENLALALHSEAGVRVEFEYIEEGRAPGLREHSVTLPADWAIEHMQAGRLIESNLGKWLKFDSMEVFIDKTTHVLANAAPVREAILNLDGTSTTKIRKTSSGSQLTVTTQEDVRGVVDLPKDLSFSLNFMGAKVEFLAPLRVKLEGNEIWFQLVDIGMLALAKAEVRRACAATLRERFPDLQVIEGVLKS